MINISTVAFQARNALRSSGVELPQTATLELISSLLGYGTYAALKLDPQVDPNQLFVEAEHVVLQPDLLAMRMRKLGVGEVHTQAFSHAVLEACGQAVAEEGDPCRFHASMDDFKDYIFENVQHEATSDGNVSSAYAETNSYIDEFYTDNFEYEPLVEEEDEWTLEASGTHAGEINPDRPYYGHAGNFTAVYIFRKDGRCGLVKLNLEFGVDFSRDYD